MLQDRQRRRQQATRRCGSAGSARARGRAPDGRRAPASDATVEPAGPPPITTTSIGRMRGGTGQSLSGFDARPTTARASFPRVIRCRKLAAPAWPSRTRSRSTSRSGFTTTGDRTAASTGTGLPSTVASDVALMLDLLARGGRARDVLRAGRRRAPAAGAREAHRRRRSRDRRATATRIAGSRRRTVASSRADVRALARGAR